MRFRFLLIVMVQQAFLQKIDAIVFACLIERSFDLYYNQYYPFHVHILTENLPCVKL